MYYGCTDANTGITVLINSLKKNAQIPTCASMILYGVSQVNRTHEMTMIWMYFTINDNKHSKTVCKKTSRGKNS